MKSALAINQKQGRINLPISHDARLQMQQIVTLLQTIEKQTYTSASDPRFRLQFGEVIEYVDRYQRLLVREADAPISCSKSCSDCCNHWVEDVNSFEMAIIADFIEKKMPEKKQQIIGQCLDDSIELERIEKLVNAKLLEKGIAGDSEAIDSVDLLLSVFYQMRRPCPLLSDRGVCMIYPVRPLTCRIYVSFSDPLRCNPDYINNEVIPTCLLDLSEPANRILDRLHFRFLQFEGDTGLRSLLGKYLQNTMSGFDKR